MVTSVLTEVWVSMTIMILGLFQVCHCKGHYVREFEGFVFVSIMGFRTLYNLWLFRILRVNNFFAFLGEDLFGTTICYTRLASVVSYTPSDDFFVKGHYSVSL